jgi:hypothetical protein
VNGRWDTVAEPVQVTYKIIRRSEREADRVIARGLTKERAEQHCSSILGLQDTPEGRAVTARIGDWYDTMEPDCSE